MCLLDALGPSSYACHTGLTTGGGGVLPRSRYRTPGPISVQPWDAVIRQQGALLAGMGRLGELIYWRPLDPGHRLVTLFPVLNLRRRLPRLDDVVMGPSPHCGRRLSVHLANEVENLFRGVRVLPPLHYYEGVNDTFLTSLVVCKHAIYYRR